MKKPKLKICGMKYNIDEIAQLRSDYLGFIFHSESPRFFKDVIPTLPSGIKKVGVFVNASIEEIAEKVYIHKLDVVQLHGEESPKMCEKLYNDVSFKMLEIWKVFHLDDSFNFDLLKPYEAVVDKFLFDTKGKNKGGNGFIFNWSILEKYPSEKPFILSGGIGIQEIVALKKLLKKKLPIQGIDINSKFEIEAGRKNINLIKKFMDEL